MRAASPMTERQGHKMHQARIARIAYRELWQQRLPHGLLSWRYLRSNPAECIRLHREFW
jgi:hypothetical protein